MKDEKKIVAGMYAESHGNGKKQLKVVKEMVDRIMFSSNSDLTKQIAMLTLAQGIMPQPTVNLNNCVAMNPQDAEFVDFGKKNVKKKVKKTKGRTT